MNTYDKAVLLIAVICWFLAFVASLSSTLDPDSRRGAIVVGVPFMAIILLVLAQC